MKVVLHDFLGLVIQTRHEEWGVAPDHVVFEVEGEQCGFVRVRGGGWLGVHYRMIMKLLPQREE